MKVEAKSAKHVINIASEATSKTMCKASPLKSRGTGTECEYYWWPKGNRCLHFTPVSKPKRSEESDSSQGLVDDIEKKTFCDYIVEMYLILCFVFAPIYCVVFIDGIA